MRPNHSLFCDLVQYKNFMSLRDYALRLFGEAMDHFLPNFVTVRSKCGIVS